MKICFVNRDPGGGGTSIEEIFDGLGRELADEVDIAWFHYSGRHSIIKNIQSLRQKRADVYHITGGVYFLAYFLRSHSIILTIHDIGGYKELKGLKKWIYKVFFLQGPMKLASAITTVSDFTRKDVFHFFGNKVGNKIKVIPNPIPGEFHRNDKSFNYNNPRILQVGTGANKNLVSVIKAVAGMEVSLVIIGKLSTADQEHLESLNIRYENYFNLEYREVYNQYCLADIVLFVSTHEGFGMPVLEAQVTGRPVIASRITSIPEIGGEGVHFIDDPMNIAEIKAGIRKVIEDEHYRNELVEKGFKNKERFITEDVVQKYRNLYKTVIARNN
jgi:glycosyltransferase involved in cell wall biosynthesis